MRFNGVNLPSLGGCKKDMAPANLKDVPMQLIRIRPVDTIL
jgi:hypothetical protein